VATEGLGLTASVGRTEYYQDPDAPTPNTLIPASNLLVLDADNRILLQRRRDTGQWALPGGAQEIGETPAQCAVRECQEETGVRAEVTGFLGVYSDPAHVVAYTDGEIRQEYEVTLIGRPVGGVPTVNDEASDVQWFTIGELGALDIHATMRRQIRDYLSNTYPHVD
jgi:8-oxo-dGTP pyrophosphatase MutT (NUDIX family)